jgi:hypothetical protein
VGNAGLGETNAGIGFGNAGIGKTNAGIGKENTGKSGWHNIINLRNRKGREERKGKKLRLSFFPLRPSAT